MLQKKLSKINYLDYIDSFKDFPKNGVIFWDFTKILSNPDIFNDAVEKIETEFKASKITKIVAIEAKGFTIGAALAYKMKKPLILIRKPELVPGKIISEKFTKEYGFGEYQIKEKSFTKKDNVLIVYDILAGSGATSAAINLVKRQKAKVGGCAFVIELDYLNARRDLKGYKLFSLVKISKKKMK